MLFYLLSCVNENAFEPVIKGDHKTIPDLGVWLKVVAEWN